jgi:xanthine dehydrogenase YagT iron-sulfur-binding subunit
LIDRTIGSRGESRGDLSGDVSNGGTARDEPPLKLVAVNLIGECGACTVHIDARRVLSCMTLAAMQEGKEITTIEGLEKNGILHPLQSAFIEHDGFQCGFCTSGQIMSGVAMIEEAKAGWPSAVTPDVRSPFALADLSRAEIRERMSGNLCRCACYPNIVDAVADVVARG